MTIQSETADSPTDSSNTQAAGIIALLFYAIIASFFVFIFIYIIVVSIIRSRLPPSSHSSSSSNHSSSNSNTMTQFVLNHFPIRSYDDHSKKENKEESSSEQPSQNLQMETIQSSSHELQIETIQEKEPETRSQSGDVCVICLESFHSQEPFRELPCNHIFHPKCIDPWLMHVSPLCPLW